MSTIHFKAAKDNYFLFIYFLIYYELKMILKKPKYQNILRKNIFNKIDYLQFLLFVKVR